VLVYAPLDDLGQLGFDLYVTLDADQQTGAADEVFAEEMIAEYVKTFDETTFAWSGDTDMDTATSAYYRIHGLRIWIELSMESATDADRDFGDFHYQSKVRDLTNDYKC